MARQPHFDWFITDWLASSAMTQTELEKKAGWSKRKASDLVSGKQKYNRDVLNDAARALNAEPFELLLHPSDAMEYRQFRKSISLAAERRLEFRHKIDAVGEQGRKAV